MTQKYPFSWEDIHTHFPKETIANIRKNMMEEYRSGKRIKSSQEPTSIDPFRHKEIVKEITKADREEIRKKQAQFEAGMELSGKNLKPGKLKRLKKEMRKSLKGCRKIAYDFNMEMSMNGEEIRISKSKVNDIIREETNYQIVEVKQLSSHLYRPPKPSIAFAMDFTEKVIAGG